ncbi:MAG: hypothetical protein CMP14_00355 [Rickettsiales bacterium]|nr:hypothetical protein [Rickettsiales bacterium]
MQFNITVPGSVESFDRYAGQEGAALDGAINEHCYRRPSSQFRREFLARVEAETGIERATKTQGDGDSAKTVYAEKEAEYWKRVTGPDSDFSEGSFADLAQDVASSISWLPTPGTGGRIGQEWLNEADNALKQVVSDSGEVNETNADALVNTMKAKGIVLNKSENGAFDRVSLAQAIKAFDAVLRNEAKSQLFTAPIAD